MSERALTAKGNRAPRYSLNDVSGAGRDLIVLTGGARAPRPPGGEHPPLRGGLIARCAKARKHSLGCIHCPRTIRARTTCCVPQIPWVFSRWSRAQMNTLPRLKPRCFYDIVVEVALVRPGPMQGRTVNPYLRRRAGREEVTYLHPLLQPALRRAMGAKRSTERMEALKGNLMAGRKVRGIDLPTRERIYEQLRCFAHFGFPESHSFSFAHIVYASAWLKVHAPEHFYATILACQPMGFYSPATLVQDARRHGVRILGPSVNDSLLEAGVGRVGEGSFLETSTEPGARIRFPLARLSPWMRIPRWPYLSACPRCEAWDGQPRESLRPGREESSKARPIWRGWPI